MRSQRKFLFLQGPHGPFFGQLAQKLLAAGNSVLRVGFNAGDEASWPAGLRYVRFPHGVDAWPLQLDRLLREQGITDLVVYGDSRPVHAIALKAARRMGLRAHCFEEGYLRPSWITYERDGTNGNSALTRIPLAHIRHLVAGLEGENRPAPVTWGSLWHHCWHGCMYHGRLLFTNAAYPGYRPHRGLSVASEWRLHSLRLFLMPLNLLRRNLDTGRLLRSGADYHLALLQLGHDSSVADHSGFTSLAGFMETCVRAFAAGAEAHEMLVFKAHPLEDGRENLRAVLRRLERQYGLKGRLLYLYGGELAPVLDGAKSVVAINSTAGQQALWRGLPVRILGRAVYDKPGLVSGQPLTDFFRRPDPPDQAAYRAFRTYLLRTSQVSGGYYTQAARATVLRRIIPSMLAEADPYREFEKSVMTGTEQLRLVQQEAGRRA